MHSWIVVIRLHQCAAPSNTCFLGPPESTSQTASKSVQPFFAQLMPEDPHNLQTLQWAAPFPLKIASLHGGIWTPSNAWFLGPTHIHNPNSISIGSAIFAEFMIVADRQTIYVVLQCDSQSFVKHQCDKVNQNMLNYYNQLHVLITINTRPASADTTARRQFQATGQPVSERRLVMQWRHGCRAMRRSVCNAGASNAGWSLCIQISRERSYTLPTYWYHSKGNWLHYNTATDSFYIMKLCSRLFVLYCRNCPRLQI